jgi:hypothetical protein
MPITIDYMCINTSYFPKNETNAPDLWIGVDLRGTLIMLIEWKYMHVLQRAAKSSARTLKWEWDIFNPDLSEPMFYD